jgi:hypothetical protein
MCLKMNLSSFPKKGESFFPIHTILYSAFSNAVCEMFQRENNNKGCAAILVESKVLREKQKQVSNANTNGV